MKHLIAVKLMSITCEQSLANVIKVTSLVGLNILVVASKLGLHNSLHQNLPDNKETAMGQVGILFPSTHQNTTLPALSLKFVTSNIEKLFHRIDQKH